MKNKVIIYQILLLFLMIVSQNILGKQYQLKKDSTYCYTAKENRIIALIISDSKRDSSLLSRCNKANLELGSKYYKLNLEFNKADTLIKNYIQIQDINNCEIDNLKSKLNKYKYILGSSIGLNIILIIILL